MVDYTENSLTPLLHIYTKHELIKGHLFGQRLSELVAEKEVALGSSRKVNGLRLGRFDFFARGAKGRTIGVEILSRPSHGKLKEKLAYTCGVDDFIFVLPEGTLELYRKPAKAFHKNSRAKCLGPEFASASLYAWLFDTETRRFTVKDRFDRVFCVEKSRR